MKKIVSFMHMSLDGFVAGPNGEMDWIKVDDEIFEYSGLMTDKADVGLYGRNTFNMMEGYWPTAADQPNASSHDKQHAAWYTNVNKVVLSRTLQDGQFAKTQIIGENVEAKIKDIKQQPGSSIVIFGSPGATRSLTALDLIDEFWIFVNPILLGSGIAMFNTRDHQQKLKLHQTVNFASGVVGLHYEVIRS